jgi:hypothetical protein
MRRRIQQIKNEFLGSDGEVADVAPATTTTSRCVRAETKEPGALMAPGSASLLISCGYLISSP